MATWDITVNGVNLNTSASQVDLLTGFGGIASRSWSDIKVPGLDGVATSPLQFESGQFGLHLWVDGSDPATGAVPETDAEREALAWSNWNNVVRVFASDALLDFQVNMPDGSIRYAKARMDGTAPPDWINSTTLFATFAFSIPKTYWDGAASWTSFTPITGSTKSSGSFDLSPFNCNGFIEDALLTCIGPAVNPTFWAANRGVSGGARPLVRYEGTLAAGIIWMVDAASMTSTVDGANRMGRTTYQGQRLMRIGPPYSVGYTASGTTSSTSWTLQAKPKFF